MTINVGERVPDVKVRIMGTDGPAWTQSGELLGTGTVVLFAVPGAFTPTCSDYHLPGFVIRSEELRAKGVDTIACISVNDVFVMAAWGLAENVADDVVMVADGNGEFAAAMGLELDLSVGGLGLRSQRYAAIIRDGVITELAVDDGGKLEVSSVEAVLALL